MLRLGLDYVRYLEPAFAQAEFLRRRTEKHLPHRLHFLTRVRQLPRWCVGAAIRLGRLAERLIPVNRAMLDFVRDVHPDVIVVTPVVIVGQSRQTELIKAGHASNVPVIIGAASWDHLTSKGLIGVVPDALTVWNETQVREASYFHRIPRSRIIITGAQSLDHWFTPTPAERVNAFRRTLGIEGHRQILLLAGSSRNMAPGDSEVQFVRRWLAALRAPSSGNTRLRDAFVLVRPHPSNTAQWQGVDLGDASTLVYPHEYSGMPLSDAEVEVFRESILASSAVVGVNTTAMIEAAILRRPVFTVRDAAFDHSQAQTLHFSYLADDQTGCVTTASSLPEHVAQLERVLADGPSLELAERFVGRFVRPLGRERPATGHLCDAIERVAGTRGAVPRRADAMIDLVTDVETPRERT
jgi:hypothetical protein